MIASKAVLLLSNFATSPSLYRAMGCGASHEDWGYFQHGPRQRARSPDDSQHYRYLYQKNFFKKQQELAQAKSEAEKKRRKSSNLAWFTQTNLNIGEFCDLHSRLLNTQSLRIHKSCSYVKRNSRATVKAKNSDVPVPPELSYPFSVNRQS